MVSKKMLKPLLDKQLSFEPEKQSFYTFLDGEWLPSTDGAIPDTPTDKLSSLVLITWNIDFMASEPRARMASSLNHLEHQISNIPSSSAVVILLQEMMDTPRLPNAANDLEQISSAPWVCDRFNITDLNTENWDSRYGQVTLVDRRLSIHAVSRLHLVSEFQRDALFVDVRLNPSSLGSERLLRLCNVHLDSMTGAMRPIQWKGIARHLQDTAAGIAASILAGDCNANRPRDWMEPQENGFKDAYLELGGVEDDERGATWGFQSIGWKRWGRKRLDKQVFCGDVAVVTLEKVGVGVEVEDVLARRVLEKEGKLTFVTDHYGLMGVYDIGGGFL
jgi:tyrosyl-DNA phosphodiesterase 2